MIYISQRLGSKIVQDYFHLIQVLKKVYIYLGIFSYYGYD